MYRDMSAFMRVGHVLESRSRSTALQSIADPPVGTDIAIPGIFQKLGRSLAQSTGESDCYDRHRK